MRPLVRATPFVLGAHRTNFRRVPDLQLHTRLLSSHWLSFQQESKKRSAAVTRIM